ncbi:amidase [Kibdelosporangium phytohabitans]|uniref:Amidase n=1 Tax=Kibdelosporangium phytohabitans TaxID=860235 RepID=A0A0N9I8S7_9PSEU|nr:amidase [Kibdelosporangium phytohabitans]ALG11310.1 amidase [Kibdelosporangium phytohabitans]MBE1462611.1 amidase [Kibdelosporangium phytohabitans]
MRLPLVLLATAALVAGPAPASASSLDLDGSTIPDLQRQMDRGRLTAVALTKAYLNRIEAVDGKIHSIVALNDRALAEAAASDARRRAGRGLSPLDGIPVLLKDNVDTRAMPTTAGSRALRSKPAADAHLVDRLYRGGAVILGKVNLSEWANFRSTRSSSGWSGVGGQTANPFVLDRNPCGSSSGSGAAIAASLAQVAIGTETDGSIVCPSGANGIVGHKPTLGLVSRSGVVPISAEQDTAGPMTRHVIDSAITLSVIQGRDPSDAATKGIPATQPRDYASLLKPDALRGARIGVWRLSGADSAVDRVVSDAVKTLRARGATVVDVDLPYQNEIGENEFAALVPEFKRDLHAYLATRPGGPDTFDELIAFNRQDPVELSKFGQEIFEQAAVAPPTTDPTYLKQRATATTLARRSIDETLAAQRLDAIMAPTNSPAWKTDYAAGDAFVLGSSGPAAVSGYPNISVPAGSAGPLPIGVSFFAGRWSDAKVLALAAAFERAADARKAPEFIPTIG